MTQELLNPADELTPVEAAKLENLEVVIEQHAASVLKVATALRTIRNERLYRVTHDSFEAYVLARFDFARAHAYRLIDFADVAGNLSPAGDTLNERQARELAKLPADQQAEAWDEATADGTPTAADVAEVVARKLWTCPNCGGQERDAEACKACHEPLAPPARDHQRDFADDAPAVTGSASDRKLRTQLTRACADFVVDVTAVFGDLLRSDRDALKLAKDVVREELIGGLTRYAKGDGE